MTVLHAAARRLGYLALIAVVLPFAVWIPPIERAGGAIWLTESLGLTRTTFSANYSEIRFRQIEPGMTNDEVTALLGAPLFVYGHDELDDDYFEEWWYALGRQNTRHHLRCVFFDDKRRVRETWADLNND